jgi:hypothetical protein
MSRWHFWLIVVISGFWSSRGSLFLSEKIGVYIGSFVTFLILYLIVAGIVKLIRRKKND